MMDETVWQLLVFWTSLCMLMACVAGHCSCPPTAVGPQSPVVGRGGGGGCMILRRKIPWCQRCQRKKEITSKRGC